MVLQKHLFSIYTRWSRLLPFTCHKSGMSEATEKVATEKQEAPQSSKRSVQDILEDGPPDPKRKKPRDKGDDTITESQLSETEYMLENGLRKVRPYWFHFTSFVKGRWIGREVFEIFSNEFRLYSKEYFKDAIADGRISVDGQKVSPSTKLKNNQWITHLVHRHEPPVTNQSVQVVFQDEEIIVINKPSSIPMHPTGGYRHNTILYILAKENGLKDLYPINRLDRLTSGVVIIARSAEKAEEFSAKIRDRSVKKCYLARTIGEFPESEITVSEPIKVVSHIFGINEADPQGKEASTIFRRISTTGRSSLVLCQPLTGRTHQIRVHLQHLGYPIINDPLYARPERLAFMKAQKKERTSKGGFQDGADGDEPELELGDEEQAKKSAESVALGLEQQNEESRRADWWEPKCASCQRPWKDPTPPDLEMYLHAKNYKGEGWEYSVPDPVWAEPDFNDRPALERLAYHRSRDAKLLEKQPES